MQLPDPTIDPRTITTQMQVIAVDTQPFNAATMHSVPTDEHRTLRIVKYTPSRSPSWESAAMTNKLPIAPQTVAASKT